MSDLRKELEAHVALLKSRLDEMNEELRAADALLRRISTEKISRTNGHADLSALSIRRASESIIMNWKTRSFTLQDVLNELESSNVSGADRSKKAIAGARLKELTAEGKLMRKNISKSLVKKYSYAWKENAS
jgi:hypothetical protein